MPKIIHTASRKAGLPPGTLVHLGEQRVEHSTIDLIDYSATELTETADVSAEQCKDLLRSETVSWINFTGLHDVERLQTLGDVFDIHQLILEDISNTNQRPKIDDHGEYLFMTMKMLYRHAESADIVAEQVSMILGDGYLITFQEMEGDVFGTIRQRIRDARGRIRAAGAGYLAYALIDAIVDNYFVVLEDVGEAIETLQERVLRRPEPTTLRDIHRLKGEIIFIRKALWPMREAVSSLEKGESHLMAPETFPYLRDVYEHVVQVIDTIEVLRDMLGGAMEIYMSSVSNRMNQVMQVLTVIATIFIPLTFIAGIYGMNFETMPELKWPYGYAAVWGVMVTVAVGMLAFFRTRKWL